MLPEREIEIIPAAPRLQLTLSIEEAVLIAVCLDQSIGNIGGPLSVHLKDTLRYLGYIIPAASEVMTEGGMINTERVMEHLQYVKDDHVEGTKGAG
jgi:hypothetical protein